MDKMLLSGLKRRKQNWVIPRDQNRVRLHVHVHVHVSDILWLLMIVLQCEHRGRKVAKFGKRAVVSAQT